MRSLDATLRRMQYFAALLLFATFALTFAVWAVYNGTGIWTYVGETVPWYHLTWPISVVQDQSEQWGFVECGCLLVAAIVAFVATFYEHDELKQPHRFHALTVLATIISGVMVVLLCYFGLWAWIMAGELPQHVALWAGDVDDWRATGAMFYGAAFLAFVATVLLALAELKAVRALWGRRRAAKYRAAATTAEPAA